jgi:hypothetical protein
MPSPLLDDDLCFFQAAEDLSVEQFVPELCSDMPASRQATGVGLRCAIDTSIWRSSVTICSALNLFFGMTQAPFQAILSQRLVQKSPVRSASCECYQLVRKRIAFHLPKTYT